MPPVSLSSPFFCQQELGDSSIQEFHSAVQLDFVSSVLQLMMINGHTGSPARQPRLPAAACPAVRHKVADTAATFRRLARRRRPVGQLVAAAAAA